MSCIGQAATDAQECMDNGGGGGGGGLPGGPGAPGDGTNGITREDLLWGMLCMASGQECCRDEYDLDDFLGCAALVDCLFDSPSVIYSALGTCCSQPTEAEKLGCLLGMIAVR